MVCMTSLLVRNHGKRLVVGEIAGEFGHHGESVDGAFDDCFEDGWPREPSLCGRCPRAAPRQVGRKRLRPGSSSAARSAACKT